MRALGTAILYGLLVWAIVFAVAMVITPLRQTDRPLFESIMPVALGACTALAGTIYLGKVPDHWAREGLKLGAIWLAVNLGLDALMFSWGPMRMSLADYLKDIGLTYLMIPTITLALGSAWARRPRIPAGPPQGIGPSSAR